uniref:Uncharacterized protein n=1 Tax=Heterorhabditis bacteriophora TaxID=37862 RepID=A0A1I7WWH9_HETBA
MPECEWKETGKGYSADYYTNICIRGQVSLDERKTSCSERNLIYCLATVCKATINKGRKTVQSVHGKDYESCVRTSGAGATDVPVT